MIRYGFKPSGCFVVIDDDGGYWWAHAYANSPHAEAAKRDPEGTARVMAASKEGDLRVLAAQSKRFRAENRERYAALALYASNHLAEG